MNDEKTQSPPNLRRRSLTLAAGAGLLGTWLAPCAIAANACSASPEWAEQLRCELSVR